MWFKVSYLHTTFIMLIYVIINFYTCLKVLHLNVLSAKHNGGDFEEGQDSQGVTNPNGVHHA